LYKSKGNIDETDSKTAKNPYQPMDFKNLKKKTCEPKVSRLLPNLCDLHKKKSIG
jgi:hypothetical protein